MKFVIEGRPQGKARARTFWNSRTAVSYTHLRAHETG